MIYKNIKIPSYVVSWTDRYFYQSAFDIPLNPPGKRTIKFLTFFRPNKPIRLFRGINKYNSDNDGITSWTYNKETAKNYILEDGKIIEKIFFPNKVLFDTTKLSDEQKIEVGYDYKIDDQEVLILSNI